jgi:hypothetical protein
MTKDLNQSHTISFQSDMTKSVITVIEIIILEKFVGIYMEDQLVVGS